MAKLYSKRQAAERAAADPPALLDAVDAFLRNCRRPALLEPGEKVLPLEPGCFTVAVRTERLWIEAWSDHRSLSRRILAIASQTRSNLVCTVQRFAGKPGELTIFDLDRPQSTQKSLLSERQNFAGHFRTMLSRQFPGWEIAALSAGMDLQRSFSPVFPRAHLVRGTSEIAAMACPGVESEPSMLTFALIWVRYLRQRARAGNRISLALFLPDGSGNLTSHRLRWLQNELLSPRMFRFNEHGSAGEVDPQDLGNLDTRVNSQRPLPPSFHLPAFTQVNPPERSLEAVVRASIHTLDPALLLHPVHSQILTFAGGDRDMVDLLATSPEGRLTILELKVSEDIHLPLQALDYWMRVKWHAERQELESLFPGLSIARRSPKLILAAPAMSFHSTHATVLSYFSPEIEVERIGINSDWQRQLRVILRLEGADNPISHGSMNGIAGSS